MYFFRKFYLRPSAIAVFTGALFIGAFFSQQSGKHWLAQSGGEGWCCVTVGNACTAMSLLACGSSGGFAHDLDKVVCDRACGVSLCGNGVRDGAEACDDRNMQNNDGCSASCAVEDGWQCRRGDGIAVDQGYCCYPSDIAGSGECDLTSRELCTQRTGFTGIWYWSDQAQCQQSAQRNCAAVGAAVCGNGRKEENEACDDGDNANGDGCSAQCAIESGWTCIGSMPSECSRVAAAAEPQVDLKINGSDGPVTIAALREIVTASWTSNGMEKCTFVGGPPSGWLDPLQGSKQFPFNFTRGGVSITCSPNAEGTNAVVDFVDVVVAGQPQLPPGLLPSATLRYTITPEGLTDFPRFPPYDLRGDLFRDGEEKTYRLTVKNMAGAPVKRIRAVMPRRSQGLTFVPLGSSASCSFMHPDAPVVCDTPELAGGQEISFLVRFRASCTNYFGNDQWSRPQVFSLNTMPADSNVIPDAMIAGCPRDMTGIRVCGDGIISGMYSDECDDGNTASGDGCSASCESELYWACKGSPSVCATTYTCGNGIVERGEKCDDGNTANGDWCSQICVVDSSSELTQCNDEIDNDSDGATDKNDFSCTSASDDDETIPESQCKDGLDNDGDGKIDSDFRIGGIGDPGCSNPQDNDESDTFNVPVPTLVCSELINMMPKKATTVDFNIGGFTSGYWPVSLDVSLGAPPAGRLRGEIVTTQFQAAAMRFSSINGAFVYLTGQPGNASIAVHSVPGTRGGVRIEFVDPATGRPDGSLWGGNIFLSPFATGEIAYVRIRGFDSSTRTGETGLSSVADYNSKVGESFVTGFNSIGGTSVEIVFDTRFVGIGKDRLIIRKIQLFPLRCATAPYAAPPPVASPSILSSLFGWLVGGKPSVLVAQISDECDTQLEGIGACRHPTVAACIMKINDHCPPEPAVGRARCCPIFGFCGKPMGSDEAKTLCTAYVSSSSSSRSLSSSSAQRSAASDECDIQLEGIGACRHPTVAACIMKINDHCPPEPAVGRARCCPIFGFCGKPMGSDEAKTLCTAYVSSSSSSRSLSSSSAQRSAASVEGQGYCCIPTDVGTPEFRGSCVGPIAQTACEQRTYGGVGVWYGSDQAQCQQSAQRNCAVSVSSALSRSSVSSLVPSFGSTTQVILCCIPGIAGSYGRCGDVRTSHCLRESGVFNDGNQCRQLAQRNCDVHVCGNGFMESFESCDDGNTVSGDGCSQTCVVEEGWTCNNSPAVVACGNGKKEEFETCDGDKGCAPLYRCTIDCSECMDVRRYDPPVCGDGIIKYDAQCDDGNTVSGDGCSPDCVVEKGWTCAGGRVCTKLISVCKTICGDWFSVGSEECDDGNTVSGDGCSASCKREQQSSVSSIQSSSRSSASSSVQSSSQSSAFLSMMSSSSVSSLSGDVCETICGDWKVKGDEECDDGNTVGGDDCSAVCTREVRWCCSVLQNGEFPVIDQTNTCDGTIYFLSVGQQPTAIHKRSCAWTLRGDGGCQRWELPGGAYPYPSDCSSATTGTTSVP